MPFLSIMAICVCRKRGPDLHRVSQRGRAAAFPLTLDSVLFHTRSAGPMGWLWHSSKIAAQVIFHVCMYHIFIHSSVDGNLGCFYVLVIVNSAAMNVGVHISFQIRLLSRYRASSEIVDAVLIHSIMSNSL